MQSVNRSMIEDGSTVVVNSDSIKHRTEQAPTAPATPTQRNKRSTASNFTAAANYYDGPFSAASPSVYLLCSGGTRLTGWR